jgi:hypothetical protein
LFSWDHQRRANHLRAPQSSPPIALNATKLGSGLATTFVEKEMSSISQSFGWEESPRAENVSCSVSSAHAEIFAPYSV